MVSRHPAKFGGHRQCGSEDITFLVADDEDSSFFLRTMIRHYCLFWRTWIESTRHIILITPIQVTTAQSSNWTKIWKLLLPVRPKTLQRRRKRIMAIAKLFALHANAKRITRKFKSWVMYLHWWEHIVIHTTSTYITYFLNHFFSVVFAALC